MENEMTNDAAVAWEALGPETEEGTRPVHHTHNPDSARAFAAGGWEVSPLYSATTVAELRDNAAKWKSLHDAMVLVHDVQERRIGRMTAQLEAAERRVAELVAIVSKMKFTKMGEAFVTSAEDMADLSIAIAALTKETP